MNLDDILIVVTTLLGGSGIIAYLKEHRENLKTKAENQALLQQTQAEVKIKEAQAEQIERKTDISALQTTIVILQSQLDKTIERLNVVETELTCRVKESAHNQLEIVSLKARVGQLETELKERDAHIEQLEWENNALRETKNRDRGLQR